MKKAIRKILSVILCAVMLFTTASTAFAAEDNSQAEIVSDVYKLGDVLIVTFDSAYCKTGEIPDVIVRSQEFKDETVNQTQVSKERLTVEVYEYEGKQYPQLFINVDFCQRVISVEIGEGVFITESGEKSPSVSIQRSQIKSNSFVDKFDVECQFKGYFIYDDPFAYISGDNKKHNYTIIGTPVNVETLFVCDYAQIWEDDVEVKYTVNGKSVEIISDEFIVEEAGEYVVEIKLNDVLKSSVCFTAVNEQTAYFDNLGSSALTMLISPVEFLLGLAGFLLMPGLGTFGGPVIMGDALETIPYFFSVLFGGPKFYRIVLNNE